MKDRFRPRNRREREFRPGHRGRGGIHKFSRRDNLHERRRNFNNQRKPFNRPFRRRGKLNSESLNEDLDKYFERKGGESLQDHLDNELDEYRKQNENVEKETNQEEPMKKEEKNEIKVEEPKEEDKKEEEKKEEVNEKKEEMEVEEKKVEKKKRGRAKK